MDDRYKFILHDLFMTVNKTVFNIVGRISITMATVWPMLGEMMVLQSQNGIDRVMRITKTRSMMDLSYSE